MQHNSSDRISLDGSLQLHQLGALKAQLLEAIKADARVDLVTENLTEASFALIQLLYAAQKHASKVGCHLAIMCSEGGPLDIGLDATGFTRARPAPPVIKQDHWLGLAVQ